MLFRLNNETYNCIREHFIHKPLLNCSYYFSYTYKSQKKRILLIQLYNTLKNNVLNIKIIVKINMILYDIVQKINKHGEWVNNDRLRHDTKCKYTFRRIMDSTRIKKDRSYHLKLNQNIRRN